MAKAIPIVICVDTSGSMGSINANRRSTMSILNEVLKNALVTLNSNPKISAGGEVAIVKFNETVEVMPLGDEDFVPIEALIDEMPEIAYDPGSSTNLSAAVIKAYELINTRTNNLLAEGCEYYSPICLTITDGASNCDSDSDKQTAIEIVKAKCHGESYQDIIIPYFLGIGDKLDLEELDRYSEAFPSGCIRLKGNNVDTSALSATLDILVQSIIDSIVITNFTGDPGYEHVRQLNQKTKEKIKKIKIEGKNDSIDIIHDLFDKE